MANTDGTTTKNTSRRPFWEKHLWAWAQSGLTQAGYCRQHQLSAPAFGWWKRQLEGKPKAPRKWPATNQAEQEKPTAVRFVEVQHNPHVDPGSGPATYEVLLSRGRAIRIGNAFDPDVLKRLIATVEASC